MSDLVAAVARAAKVDGQERAGRAARQAHWNALIAALTEVRVGAWITVNDLRPRLDQAGVPEGARGWLMRRAACLGLIELAVIRREGRTYKLTEDSTGLSANGAGVKVYERLPFDEESIASRVRAAILRSQS